MGDNDQLVVNDSENSPLAPKLPEILTRDFIFLKDILRSYDILISIDCTQTHLHDFPLPPTST